MTNGNRISFIGSRAKKIRKERGMSLSDMAEGLRMSVASYSRYESGARKPSYPAVAMMADLLGCSADYLTGSADEPGHGRTILSYQEAQELKGALMESSRDLEDAAKRCRDIAEGI